MKLKRFYFLLLLVTFLSVSCSPALQNLSKFKLKIIEYYETGQYDKDVREVVNDAISDIKGIRIKDSSAVVFDIDETALSNYEHIKKSDFGYNSKLWHEWVMEKRAPAIIGVKDFYNFLTDRKIRIIFITGRSKEEYEATLENLRSTGYTKFDTLIVRSETNKKSSASNYKNVERMVLSSMGYNIIACIGDQESDLVGDNTGIKIKLPNLLYSIE